MQRMRRRRVWLRHFGQDGGGQHSRVRRATCGRPEGRCRVEEDIPAHMSLTLRAWRNSFTMQSVHLQTEAARDGQAPSSGDGHTAVFRHLTAWTTPPRPTPHRQVERPAIRPFGLVAPASLPCRPLNPYPHAVRPEILIAGGVRPVCFVRETKPVEGPASLIPAAGDLPHAIVRTGVPPLPQEPFPAAAGGHGR